jgi:hypothetical protein
MVFISIQAIQLGKVPKNCKDIGVGSQVCVTDADAVAVADGTVVTSFWNRMETSVGRNGIYVYTSLTVGKGSQKL